MPRLRPVYLTLLLTLTACPGPKDAPGSGASTATGGTLVISAPGEPDNLMPPITTATAGQQVEELVFQRLASIGPGLNTVGDAGFIPDLARRWSWASDSLSIAFQLDSAARWHDGKPVRAADVVFSFALYKDPKTAAAAAAELANIDSVTARDSLTAVVWFRRRTPGQFFDAAMLVLVLPSHLLMTVDRSTLASAPFARAPVGSGPFRFVRWVSSQSLELAADTAPRRAQLDRVVFTVAPDPVTAYTRVATGEADLFESVRPDKVAEVMSNKQLRLLIAPALDYNYVGFNLVDPATGKPHPIFGDRSVRRALTMAIDRRSIVANIYDTLAVPARGPFTSAQASADTAIAVLPYSVDSANALLDAAGWKRGPDSLRRKNGKLLTFGMLLPTSSTPRVRAAVLLQEQFRRVGVDAKIESSDIGGFVGRMTARRFDVVIGAWSQDGGPANARDAWSSAAAAKGGNNFGAYRSAAFDTQLDSALAARSPAASHAHFAAAWRIIIDDAPAIWLAEPRHVMAINSRFVTTGMRPDAWWAGIAHWSIPSDKRIARDVAGAAR